MQPPDPDIDIDPASPIRLVAAVTVAGTGTEPHDPGELVLTCASCGARMIERKCKLVCRCDYFLSCSDYY